MMNNILLLFLASVVISCSKHTHHRTYFRNGEIKSEYYTYKGVLDGSYTEYYPNGNVWLKHKFKNGKEVDTSYIYHLDSIKQDTEIVVWLTDSIFQSKTYTSSGKLKKEGNYSRVFKDHRIGVWKFYNYQNKELDSFVEYKTISGLSYVNKIWITNYQNDTIDYKGNYFKVFSKDTVNIDDVLRLRFYLIEPFYDTKSDIVVVIPEKDEELENDYSNWLDIKLDTFHSLKNDGIPHPEIPSYVHTNLFVDFGIRFSKVGRKRIRGILVEYPNIKRGDSIARLKRELFFEKYVFVAPPAERSQK